MDTEQFIEIWANAAREKLEATYSDMLFIGSTDYLPKDIRREIIENDEFTGCPDVDRYINGSKEIRPQLENEGSERFDKEGPIYLFPGPSYLFPDTDYAKLPKSWQVEICKRNCIHLSQRIKSFSNEKNIEIDTFNRLNEWLLNVLMDCRLLIGKLFLYDLKNEFAGLQGSLESQQAQGFKKKMRIIEKIYIKNGRKNSVKFFREAEDATGLKQDSIRRRYLPKLEKIYSP